MSETTDLTVTLSLETRDQLAELSRHTKRDQGLLGAEAIADYVARELAIVEAIERGRADVRAGRVVSHSEVVRAAHDVIEHARSARAT